MRRTCYSDEEKYRKKEEPTVDTRALESILKRISSKARKAAFIVASTGLKTDNVLNILLTLKPREIIKQLQEKNYG